MIRTNRLRFFQDNTSGGGTGEAAAGSIARLRIYATVLSAAEIAGLDRQSSSVKFSAAGSSVGEAGGSATITVIRTGCAALPATVGYTTSDETAKQSLDYLATSGTLSFAAGETSKIFQVPIIHNQIVDLDRQLTLFLQNPNSVALEAQSVAVLTIADNETVPPTWQGVVLTSSEVEIKTWTTGGRTYAYLKLLFPNDGYRVVNWGQTVKALGRQPKLSEFLPDARFVGNGIVVNGQLSAAKINQNRADLAAQFVNCADGTKYRCSEFKAIYDGLNNQQYVDQLLQTTGINASTPDRTALVNGLNSLTETRRVCCRRLWTEQ